MSSACILTFSLHIVYPEPLIHKAACLPFDSCQLGDSHSTGCCMSYAAADAAAAAAADACDPVSELVSCTSHRRSRRRSTTLINVFYVKLTGKINHVCSVKVLSHRIRCVAVEFQTSSSSSFEFEFELARSY